MARRGGAETEWRRNGTQLSSSVEQDCWLENQLAGVAQRRLTLNGRTDNMSGAGHGPYHGQSNTRNPGPGDKDTGQTTIQTWANESSCGSIGSRSSFACKWTSALNNLQRDDQFQCPQQPGAVQSPAKTMRPQTHHLAKMGALAQSCCCLPTKR